MNVACPACGATASLDVLVADKAAASVLTRAVNALPEGGAVLSYLALFRPAQRRLTWPRVNTLLGELLPAIESGVIERNGKRHDVSLAAWAAGFDIVLRARDDGKLATPLKSHGYLFEVVIAECERAQRAGAVHIKPETVYGSHAPGAVSRELVRTPAKPASAVAAGVAALEARKQRRHD